MSHPLLLIVEDEPAMRRLLSHAVDSHGYESADAGTGAEAIACARAMNPDVILLDLGLPDMDGIEVTKQLRTFTRAPIIVVSARGQEEQKIMALDVGANDYLTKPISMGELMARVRVALRAVARSTQSPDAPLVLGNLTIDLQGRRVFREGRLIHLSPLEFKVLAVLVRNLGSVVTKKQLLEEAWGTQEDRGHYVRIYMHALRHKLEPDPARPRFLMSEVGIGYRLKGE
jgi:two-component system KDP operon response regulator KdpE